jgi:NhaP-type Na+/H+ and K+/H+ antiporter
MATFTILYSIAFLLFTGLIGYLVSHRLRLPHSLVLISLGIVYHFAWMKWNILVVPKGFIESMVLIAFIMLVFDIFSRYDLISTTTIHAKVRSFKVLTALIALPLLTLISGYLLGLDNILIAILLSALLLPNSRLFLKRFTPIKNRVSQFIEVESIKLTALALMISAMTIYLLPISGTWTVMIWETLQAIGIGLGTGLVGGLFFIKIMKNNYSHRVSHLGLMTAVLIVYSLTSALGGVAMISVMTIGFFFGSVRVKNKPLLYEFSGTFAEFSEIGVFLILGMMLPSVFIPSVLVTSIIIFLILILFRFVLLSLTIPSLVRMKERIFLSIFSPKDITTAVVALFLLFEFGALEEISIIFNSVVTIIILSVILAWGASIFEEKFYKKYGGMAQSEM